MPFFKGSKLAQSKAPPPTMPQCGACGLHKKCITPKIGVNGEGRQGILILSEAPSQREDHEGELFMASTGKKLELGVAKAGMDLRADTWRYNAVICHPGETTVDAKIIDYCRPNLRSTIKQLNPRIIIPIGSAAITSLLGWLFRPNPGGPATWSGFHIPCQQLNTWIAPLWHPSFIDQQDHKALDQYFNDYLVAALQLPGRPWETVPDYKKDVRVILNDDEAAHYLQKMIDHQRPIAFDYECNCLKPDWPEAHCVSAAVTWAGRRTIAFPMRAKAKETLGRLLRSPCPKIAANLKYEDRWTRMLYGHRVRNWYFDTMQGMHVVDNRKGINSVGFQGFALLGAPDYEDHIKPFLKSRDDSKYNRIETEIEISDLLLYNGLDALLEYKIAGRQMELLNYPKPEGY